MTLRESLPHALSDLALAHLADRDAQFDPTRRTTLPQLRSALAELGLPCWPAIERIECDFGGLRIDPSGEAWLLGAYAACCEDPGRMVGSARGVPLVCVGGNETGRLFADEEGIVWDEDFAAGTVEPRAESMLKRIEKEACNARVTMLDQIAYAALRSDVDAGRAAERLGLTRLTAPSDRYDTWWQSEALTLLRTPDDVRLFARDEASLQAARDVAEAG